MDNTDRTEDRDNQGRFTKGNCANPKGNNQFTCLAPLLKALSKAGLERGEEFWDRVANKCWMNDQVLVAVLRKLVPDMTKMEVEGEGLKGPMQIVVIKSKEISGDTTQAVPGTLPAV